MEIDYSTLSNEIINLLNDAQTMILATCFGSKVTARTMNLVNDGLTIYMQTDINSEKGKQIRGNPNVALAVNNIQIEAVAHFTEDTVRVGLCSKLFRAKFPRLYEKYADLPEEPTLVCEPLRIQLYKVISGKPCGDVLDIKERRAYRIF